MIRSDRITKDQFNKLSQLDRIEYRLKYNGIKDFYDASATFSIFKIGFFTLLFVMGLLYIGIMVDVEHDKILNLTDLLGRIITAFIIFIAIGWVIDLIIAHLERKALKALDDEYFNFKAEVKNATKNK